jgi:hypothetical protein
MKAMRRCTVNRPSPAMRAVLLMVCAIAPLGCGGADESSLEAPVTPDAAESVVKADDISMAVRASPKRIQVGDQLNLTIEVVAPSDTAAVLPRVEESLGDFTVLDARTPPDVPEGDRRRWTHRYLLDTFAAGDLEIPPLTVTYSRSTEDDQAPDEIEPIELSSEPLVIAVTSALAGTEQPTDFRDIKGMVEVSREAKPLWRWITAVIIVVLAAAAAVVSFMLLRRKRGSEAVQAPPLPPHVWARRELDALATDDLLGHRRFHEFYYRLSGIVREYIERRFGIMAPERTTEEFLREMRRHDCLSEGHKSLLASFLRAADMVKFARHEPAIEDGEHAFDAAGSFVDETTPPVDGSLRHPGRSREPVEVSA